ncbi:WxL protein peptidoglycan domain-containing protein [Tengunoibacter tsumagoiensis]|uniref:WxL Interacting Protein peptidoglycan binding domain-containing protein n=1 Tax=Tengunoibacter tsumagoiensis TaxID=2014871 RepID=A0A402A7T6_9CHLR|nr:DUF916 domain-containing protein [Tengunoibacter tsumagoiensis]GCE15224.1 hypothetical protein KTT_50830 [Tengunoibacter tsumagoiensis]
MYKQCVVFSPITFLSCICLIYLGWFLCMPGGGLFVSAAAHEKGPHFSIEPTFDLPYNLHPRSYFIYNTTPGAQIIDRLRVTNDGDVRGTVSFYAVDATTAQDSGTMFFHKEDAKHDVGAWISLSQQELTLNAGQSSEVAFTVTVPTNVRPGQHGGGIIAQDLTTHTQKSTTQLNSVEIGLQSLLALGVLINLPGPVVEDLQATGVSYDSGSNYQRVLVDLQNNGNQLLYPSGTLQILDEHKRTLQDLPLSLQTFLPQTSISYPVYMQKIALTAGKRYTAMVHLIYGHEHTLNYTTLFQVPFPDRGPLNTVVQHLIPASTNSGDFFSQLTPWHYGIAIFLLFFLISACFFWGKKISGWIRQLRTKE